MRYYYTPIYNHGTEEDPEWCPCSRVDEANQLPSDCRIVGGIREGDGGILLYDPGVRFVWKVAIPDGDCWCVQAIHRLACTCTPPPDWVEKTAAEVNADYPGLI